MISLKIDQEQLRRLEGMVDEDDTREKARLGSLSLPHAGDWLNCAPIKSLGLHLRPSEFVLAVKYSLYCTVQAGAACTVQAGAANLRCRGSVPSLPPSQRRHG